MGSGHEAPPGAGQLEEVDVLWPFRIPRKEGGCGSDLVMKLILHIGTHKTATTTIQKVLAKNRENLIKQGIWYPAYSDVLRNMAEHYAHLELAKGLMSGSNEFTPEKVKKFFDRLQKKAKKWPDMRAVLISAEPFYRGRLPGDGRYWERQDQYIQRVKETVPFDDIEVVLVLRRQDDYLESLYNEHVKATRYKRDIWRFLDDYRSRFEYAQQIKAWSKYFPVIQVHTFEDLVKAGDVTSEFLRAVLGVNVVLEEAEGERNVSLPVDLIEFKRLLNGTSLSRAELGEVVKVLTVVAEERTKEARRRSRLSVEDCEKVLAMFDDDNEWINHTYFSGRPEGLFSSTVGERDVVNSELDRQAIAKIAAEIFRTEVLPRRA